MLYGVMTPGIDETANAISVRLGCAFQERASDYFGIYKLASVGSAEIKVVSQPDPEGDPLEDDFDDFGTLVYVEAQDDFPELEGLRIGSESLARLRTEQ